MFGLTKVYEGAFAISTKHEHVTEAEQAVRGDAIPGCDNTIGPTKRAKNTIKRARVETKASSIKTTITP